MASGRVVFGYNKTRPDIIPDPYTNIHTYQVNRVKKWTRTRTHRVSVGYRVSGGYATVKYKFECKLMSNTVYDRWELMNNITTCEIDKQHHQREARGRAGAARGRRSSGAQPRSSGREARQRAGSRRTTDGAARGRVGSARGWRRRAARA
jgi:hypothetical protein